MLRQMLYRGPSRQMLHERYAKCERIDEHAPIITSSDVVIDAPIDYVWARLINLPAWPSIAPSIRDVRLESAIEVDAYFTFRLYNIPIRAQFAVVRLNSELTWTGASLWFTAIDRHLVEPLPSSATRLSIAESFAGVLAVPLMNRARLKAQHEQWLRAFKQAAECKSSIAMSQS